MNKALSVILSVFIMFFANGCSPDDTSSAPKATTTEQTTTTQTEAPVAEISGGFSVDGTKLIDAKGNEFIMRGVNHAHTWYKDKRDEALEAIAATCANTVRIVLSNGIQWDKDSAEDITAIIEKCKELKLIAVLEVHDGTGKDDVATLESIADYWVEVKDALIGNEAYAILNIANEWVGQWKGETWRDGYVSVIPKIRDAGITNTILVDSAGWGQYAKSVADYGAEVFVADPQANTMFAIHMYGSAGKNENTIKTGLEGVTSQNLAVIVGEFGYNHSDGDVDEAYIMKYCQENGIGYLGWSWKGNSGGVEYLDIATEWDGSALSGDWGEVLINGENGIKATSKACSVFE